MAGPLDRPAGPPGPYGSGSFGQTGGRGEIGSDGRVHYTDYWDGFHVSWDEGKGGISGVHSTIHDLGVRIEYSTDNRGNPR